MVNRPVCRGFSATRYYLVAIVYGCVARLLNAVAAVRMLPDRTLNGMPSLPRMSSIAGDRARRPHTCHR